MAQAKYAYEYGKRWHAETPRYAIARYVDRQHVSTSLDAIADHLIATMEASPDCLEFTKAIRREVLAYAAIRHSKNRGLYDYVMRGR